RECARFHGSVIQGAKQATNRLRRLGYWLALKSLVHIANPAVLALESSAFSTAKLCGTVPADVTNVRHSSPTRTVAMVVTPRGKRASARPMPTKTRRVTVRRWSTLFLRCGLSSSASHAEQPDSSCGVPATGVSAT